MVSSHLVAPVPDRAALADDPLFALLTQACTDLDTAVSTADLWADARTGWFPTMTLADRHESLLRAARARVEGEPDYGTVAARLLLAQLGGEVDNTPPVLPIPVARYGAAFHAAITDGVAVGLLDSQLATFDLARLAAALCPARDDGFTYLGLQTIYDRYLLQWDERRFELPQVFWMRVAMGLAVHEADREMAAIEFYTVLSQFHFVSATPTLFNAGTTHPQLSSCYLTTVPDNLEGIFSSIRDNALLSKWAGGLGNDWTPIRGLGAPIRGTNGKSQGVIPFLKIVNDTAIAVNQGGKRKGAVCAYLELWHRDIEDFLDLRKNTGDERRRTHDMHTAAWIPDLFMERVIANGTWTLFSPDDVPDLHDRYGRDFARHYTSYEDRTRDGSLPRFTRVGAVALWRKLLTRLYETGHPWLTWKDPINLRSPQDHVGVIHSSNLCTEIVLNTSADETAVCNLGSVNLAAHIRDGALDHTHLQATIRTAVRMLDNVIEINYYPTPEARTANLRHRPIGLGVMGFQDALYQRDIAYASDAAVAFADHSMEAIAFYALLASSELAAERGTYATYAGSKWDRGLLPLDTLALLAAERDTPLMVDTSATLEWERVRAAIRAHGMRNSNVLAIAPTATIANIAGVSASIEPTYRHLYVKSNLSGDFTTITRPLVEALKARGLWDAAMVADLKYFDGTIQPIDRIPNDLKARFATAFEIAPEWLIACASRRQKWLDQSQSLNLYLAGPSGTRLAEIYMLAWRMGLKTTYYLRTLGATQVEKSTLDINRYGLQPRWMQHGSASGAIVVERDTTVACAIDDETCEACQ